MQMSLEVQMERSKRNQIFKSPKEINLLLCLSVYLSVIRRRRRRRRRLLKGFSIKDQDLKKFSTDYPNLKELTLRSCSDFSFTGLEAVAAGCRNLTHLVARSSTFLGSNSKSKFLASLHKENVVSIEVSGSNVGNNCIGDPKNLLKLIKSATGLEHLGGVANTKGKKLSGRTCNKLSNQLNRSGKLESLFLASVENSSLPVPGFCIDTFLPVASQVTTLNLRGLVVDRKDHVRMITSCINIRILQASLDNLDDFAVDSIGKHCKRLLKVKYVASDGKSNITDVFSWISGKNLEALNVKVAAVGKTPDLSALAKSCPRLEKLVIENCRFSSLPGGRFKEERVKVCLAERRRGVYRGGKMLGGMA